MSRGIYKTLEVTVEFLGGKEVCRTYQLVEGGGGDALPSPQYMEVIIRGAKQAGLPPDYVNKLQGVQTNGYTGEVQVQVPL